MKQENNTNIWCLLGFIFAFVMPLLGLIFSIIGVKQVKKTNESGKGLGIAGIVVSSVFIFIGLIVIIGMFAMLATI